MKTRPEIHSPAEVMEWWCSWLWNGVVAGCGMVL